LDKALEIKRRAQKRIQAGDLDGAVAEYERLLAAEETDPYLFVTLGDLVYKKGDLPGAGLRYREAAEAYERTGLIKNAIAVCKKMLRLNLDPLDTTRFLGELHAQDGLSGDAAVYFNQYVDQCLSKDNRKAAAEALERVAELCTDDPQYGERVGELWGTEGETLRGAQAMLAAAAIHERQGAGDEAERLRRRAEEIHPGAASEAPVEPGDAGAVAEGASPGEQPAMDSPNGGSPVEGLDSRQSYEPPAAGAVQREELDTSFGGAGRTVPTQAVPGDVPVDESSGSSTEDVPASVAEHLDRAKDLLAEGDRVQAADELLAAGRAWEEVGGLEQASAIYQELAKSPQASERLYREWLSNCERRQQWAEAAIVCCELGDLALAAQEPAAAHEWFVQARAYDQNNEKAMRRLERLAEWGDRPDTAAGKDRITVTGKVPDNLDVNLGELLSAFRQEVQEQVDPEDAQSRYDLGLTYRQMGLLDEAIAEFRLASRSADFRLKAVDMLGRCLMERGEFGAAIAELEKTLATGGLPVDAELNFRYNLGLALEASGRPVEALEQFEAVFSSEPNYPEVALKIRELRR
jgi:tetratricopeptide (TPR) repeat protein